MDPYDPAQLLRLREDLTADYRKLAGHRAARKELVRLCVDPKYADAPETHRRDVVNLLQQTAETYTMSLAGDQPRVLISTPHVTGGLTAFAHQWQLLLNALLERVCFAGTMQNIVLDAFYRVGIVKVMQSDSPAAMVLDDQRIDVGRPSVRQISLDNWFHDCEASSWEECRRMGEIYSVDLWAVRNNERFDPNIAKQVRASDGDPQNDLGEEPTSAFTTNRERMAETQHRRVNLADVYLSATEQVVTLAWDQKDLPPLAVTDLTGLEGGPYSQLSYLDVSDNVMPGSVGGQLEELHALANRLVRKGSRQAGRQKTILAYAGEASDDVRSVLGTPDGAGVKVAHPDAMKEMDFGGVDPTTHAFLLGTLDLFDRMAGNLQAMAGLGPQAETLGQDQLIHAAVSKKEARLQQRTISFTAEVCRKLGWIMWHDKFFDLHAIEDVPGWPAGNQVSWDPTKRVGEFPRYDFRIEPYSMAYKSPTQRLGFLLQIAERLFIPAETAGILAAQGGHLDWQTLTEMVAELGDMPRLKQLIRFDRPASTPEQGPLGQLPRQSPHTSRTYIRKNIPTGGTEQSRRATMMQTLFSSGQANSDQMAAMSR